MPLLPESATEAAGQLPAPPVATQEVAFCVAQLICVDWPWSITDGVALKLVMATSPGGGGSTSLSVRVYPEVVVINMSPVEGLIVMDVTSLPGIDWLSMTRFPAATVVLNVMATRSHLTPYKYFIIPLSGTARIYDRVP